MEQRLGIIAGSGDFALFVQEEAQKRGYSCVVAAIKGLADTTIQDKVGIIEWFDMTSVFGLISFFKKNGVKKTVFAGKIDNRIIYKKSKLGQFTLSLISGGKDKSPTSLIKIAIDFLAKQGIEVIDPTEFISSAFCTEGVLSKIDPSPGIVEDIYFGWKTAKKIADLDIGQTVIVKDNAVVAVEGIEGTDEAIKRGGELAGEGIVVVKVSRTNQDARIDLPAVGFDTIKSLAEVGGKALCFEAEKVPFFQKFEAISMANKHKISIVVKKADTGKEKNKDSEKEQNS